MYQIIDSASVVLGTRRTSDGYLAGTVRAARTGVQVYRRKELGLTEDTEGFINVYRPPEVVFDADSLKTYAGKPITMGHPPKGVNATTWKELAVGHVGGRVVRDGEGVLVDIAVMDHAAIDMVHAGTAQVSMGYTTQIMLQDGVSPEGVPYQAVQVGPLVINHLAVVDHGRAGEEFRIAVGDANGWGASPVDHKETPMSTKVVVLGDTAVTVPVADAAAIEAYKATLQKQLADAKAKNEDELAKKDEELGELKAKNKQLQDAAVTPDKLAKLIADRTALEAAARPLLGDSADGITQLSDADVRRTAVAARLGDAAVEGASDAEISGMFRAITMDHANDDPVREAVRSKSFHDASMQTGFSDRVAAAAGVTFRKGA